MTYLKKTATFAVIAMMSAAPLAVTAASTGSPEQSVDADPNEDVAKKPVTTDSVVENVETGSPAQSVDSDPSEEVAESGDGEGTIADELPTNSPAVSDS